MLNGCKSCSIFAIQDIELYFIFIAAAWKHQPMSNWLTGLLLIRHHGFHKYNPAPFLDPLTSSYHKKIMSRPTSV